MFTFPQPQYVACADCGACILRSELDDHVCEADRRLDYLLVRLRPWIESFAHDFGAWLETPAGRFADYYAARTRP